MVSRPIYVVSKRNFAKKIEIYEDDAPVPYSESKAAMWKAEHSRHPPAVFVSYTPFVVTLSLIVFLSYFCIFREENDIDELLYRPLSETIKGVDDTSFKNVSNQSQNKHSNLYQKTQT